MGTGRVSKKEYIYDGVARRWGSGRLRRGLGGKGAKTKTTQPKRWQLKTPPMNREKPGPGRRPTLGRPGGASWLDIKKAGGHSSQNDWAKDNTIGKKTTGAGGGRAEGYGETNKAQKTNLKGNSKARKIKL